MRVRWPLLPIHRLLECHLNRTAIRRRLRCVRQKDRLARSMQRDCMGSAKALGVSEIRERDLPWLFQRWDFTLELVLDKPASLDRHIE